VPRDALADALGFLAEHEVVHPARDGRGELVYHWAAGSYPANNVSLRSVGWDNFVIIDLDTDKTIAEMDWRSTHTMLHVQAIYQHDGGSSRWSAWTSTTTRRSCAAWSRTTTPPRRRTRG
jgi:DEAD/DEAH box helicase domain-containing protein